MVDPAERRERRGERNALLLGILTGAAIVLLLFLLRLLGSNDSSESDSAAADSVPAARVALTSGSGEISRFERRISDELVGDPVRTRPLTGLARVRITGVHWLDPRGGGQFVDASSVNALLDMGAAARGNFVVRDVVVRDPDLLVVQTTETDTWNWERALAPLLEPSEPGRPKRTAIVFGATILNGTARVRPVGGDYTFTDVNSELTRVVFSQPGLDAPYLDVATASATMQRAGSTQRYPISGSDAHITLPDTHVGYEVREATVAGARLTDIEGIWSRDLPGYGVRATGVAPDIDFTLLRPYFARLPENGNASFAWSLDPLPDGGLRVGLRDLALRSGTSRASGTLVADIPATGTPSLFSADLQLDPLDLALVKQLTGRDFAYTGTLRGRVTGNNSNIHFDVNARLAGGQLRETLAVALTGDADFTRAAPVRVQARTEVGGGIVALNGTVDLRTSVPSYDLRGRIVGVHLDRVVTAQVPPVSVNARVALSGSGFDPATMQSRFGIAGRFTGWRAAAGDTIHVAGSFGRGALTLDTANVRLATLTLDAGGSWSYRAGTGGLTYRFAVESLFPFGAYIPSLPAGAAAGAVNATGTIAGTLAHPRLAGTFAVDSARYNDYSVRTARGDYDLALRATLPDLRLSLDATDIVTPSLGQFRTGTVRMTMVTPSIDLQVHADRVGGGVVQIVANGTIDPVGRREVTLRQLALDFGEGRWSNVRPAVFVWGNPPGITIRDLAIREENGPGSVTMDGRVLPVAQADFNVDAVQLPLSELSRLMGRDSIVTGRVSLSGSVRGPADAPVIDMRMQMDSGSVRRVGFHQLTGSLQYAAQRATTTLNAILNTGGRFELSAAVPLALNLADSTRWRLLDTGALQGTLVADSVPLAALAALSPDIQEASGALSARVTLGGTSQNPELGGAAQLFGGSVLVPLLNQRFDSIAGTLVLENRQIAVRDVRVRSGGYATVTGTIDFPKLRTPEFDLLLRLDSFEPIGAGRRNAAKAHGEMRLTGPLASSVLTGSVSLDDGDLAMPVLGRPDILDIDITDPSTAAPLIGTDIETNAPGWYSSLRIDDLGVAFGQNLWFAAEQTRVQLSGQLSVNKSGPDVILTGDLTGQRGTFTLMAGPIVRRFDIIDATVRFLGDAGINPVIDATAQRTVIDQTGRELQVQAHVGGTLERPTLSLSAPGGPAVPQSELLSTLVFGQPTIGLAGGLSQGTALVGETLFGGISEVISMDLESAIGGQLGLDVFQIRPGNATDGSIAAPTLVAGREIAPDVFLTVESALAVLFSGQGATTNQALLGAFAVRLEWRLTRQYSARFGWEPSSRGRIFGGFNSGLPSAARPKQQFTAELRRRWTY